MRRTARQGGSRWFGVLTALAVVLSTLVTTGLPAGATSPGFIASRPS